MIQTTERFTDLIAELERRRDAVGVERDKLRELLSDWESVADSCDTAHDYIDLAIQALSEYA